MTELSKAMQGKNIKMTEDRFWYIVDKINWTRLSQSEKLDIDTAQANVISLFNLNRKGVRDLRSIASIAWKLLDKKVGDRNPAGSGDDSHSDLLYHIIGLGRDEFYANLNEYWRIQKRGEAPYGSPDGYRESFVYVLPCESDMPDDRKEYDVTITATVTKTIRVKADSEDEATKIAHSEFTVAPEEGEGERYDEQTVDCKEVVKTS
jgi:hypothetical protein